MPFQRSTLQTIIDRIITDFRTRITGANSLLRRSTLGVIARVFAGAVHLVYEYLDFQARQIFVSTADEAGLEAHSSEYGIARKAAVSAVGSGEATGTDGIVIPEDSELISPNGQTYLVDADVTIAAGVVTLAFTAKVAGEDGNDDAGIVLSFVSPIAGVNTSVTIDADGISNGADEESDDDLRERVLTRKRQPPHGGASFDYVFWALEVAEVTRAWCIPQYTGVGTVGVAFVCDGVSPIVPDAAKRAIMAAYIIEHEDPATGDTVGIPVTAEPGLTIITLAEVAVNFDISIYPNTAAVQAAVQVELGNLFREKSGPEQTIYLSNMSEAISNATNEERHTLNSPVVDLTATTDQVHVVGTFTWSDY